MLVLNGRQRAVEAALARKSAELVTFYVGALSAVAYEANPDRLAQAAHGMRELMEKFPKYVDVAIPVLGQNWILWLDGKLRWGPGCPSMWSIDSRSCSCN